MYHTADSAAHSRDKPAATIRSTGVKSNTSFYKKRENRKRHAGSDVYRQDVHVLPAYIFSKNNSRWVVFQQELCVSYVILDAASETELKIYGKCLDTVDRSHPSSSAISICGTFSMIYLVAISVSSLLIAASKIARSSSERIKPDNMAGNFILAPICKTLKKCRIVARRSRPKCRLPLSRCNQ